MKSSIKFLKELLILIVSGQTTYNESEQKIYYWLVQIKKYDRPYGNSIESELKDYLADKKRSVYLKQIINRLANFDEEIRNRTIYHK